MDGTKRLTVRSDDEEMLLSEAKTNVQSSMFDHHERGATHPRFDIERQAFH